MSDKPARESTSWTVRDGSGTSKVSTTYVKGSDYGTQNNNWSDGHKEARTTHPDGTVHHKTNHGSSSKYSTYDVSGD